METAAYIRDMATRARSAAAELAKMTTDEKNAAKVSRGMVTDVLD